MFLEYFRPKNLDEALKLLERPQPETIPLGGGTSLSHGRAEPAAVVDLQDLPLRNISRQGNYLHVGAMVSLQTLHHNSEINAMLARALHHEATGHIRNMASVAGTLVTADGRSIFATALLALDAKLVIQPGDREISLGDWLPHRNSRKSNDLIVEIIIPLQPALRFELVARSPEDLPIVCVAIGIWPSGRTRIALGGTGAAPILALDGPEPGGAEAAVENAYSQATDAFATGLYRSEAAKAITRRLLSLGEVK